MPTCCSALSNPSTAYIQRHIPAPATARRPDMQHLPSSQGSRFVLGWVWGFFCLFGFGGFFVLADSWQGGHAFRSNLKGMSWPSVLKLWFYFSFLRWMQPVLRNAMRCQNEGWFRALTVSQVKTEWGIVVSMFGVYCYYSGEKINTTFCWHEHSEIRSKLRAAGEEFLKRPCQLYTNT